MSDELHDLAAAYALDALDDDERAAFEAHLEHCADCRAEVASHADTAAALADAAAAPPPPDLKGRVMGQVAATEQLAADRPAAAGEPGGSPGPPEPAPVTPLRRRVGRRPLAVTLAAAAAVVLVVAGALVLTARGGDDGVDDVLAAPDAIERQLAGDGDDGDVRVVWSPEQQRVALLADGVAVPEDGFVYELWAIVDGTPEPAGLFETDDGTIEDVADVGDVEPMAWGVTIEPAGGSPAPTGDILYAAEV